MKNTQKRFALIGLWLLSVVASFCAGAFLIYEYYVFGDPVSAVTTHIDVCPPIDGPLYSLEDFVRANSDVKNYLNKAPEFRELHLRFIVVPEMSGYTIYSSSGQRGTAFPRDLYDSTLEVFKRSLWE